MTEPTSLLGAELLAALGLLLRAGKR